MRGRSKQFIIGLAGFLLAALLAAQPVSNLNATAYPILSLGSGARAVGMGKCFTAVADDASAVYYNPAGLAQIRQPEIALAHNLYLADGFYDNAEGVYPLPGEGGTLAFDARYLNYGNIDKRDSFGNLLGTYTPFDVSVEGAFGFPVSKTTFLGFSSQWINENIDGTVESGLVWNAGLLLTPLERLTLGVNLKNLGVDTGGGSLPTELLWGGALRPSLGDDANSSFLFSVGGSLAFQGVSRLNGGVEYGIQKFLFLRGGYDFYLQDNPTGGIQGLDFGAGVRIGQFQFDYAFSFEGDLGNIQLFSLSLFFEPLPEPSPVVPAPAYSDLLLPPPFPGLPLQGSSLNNPANQPVTLKFKVITEGNLTARELFDQAEIKLKMGLKGEALELYVKAVEKDPEFQAAWDRLGRLYFDKSLESYRKALELDPQNERLREWLSNFQQH